MVESLSIVGAGRVGRALGRRLHELGWKMGVVCARSESSARKAVRFIGAGKPQAGLSVQVLASKVVLLTVPDDAIAAVAGELARIGGDEWRGRIVLHTSGALDSTVLSPLKACGAAVGSMHPLQSFSGVGIPPLQGRVFGIEGDEPAVRVARSISRALEGTPVKLTAEKKALYHAAGAFAAGHLLAMEEAGVQLLMNVGMKRAAATKALLSLSRQVLDNYEKLGPHYAWTGPLSRGDYGVVASHHRALQENRPEFREAYQSVSRLAAQVLSQETETMLKELETISERLQVSQKQKGDEA
jgi:predicted short-subunit dehydrogenase-like oxidoreductase (DUF2520 family)